MKEQKQKIFFWMALYLWASALMGLSIYVFFFSTPPKVEQPKNPIPLGYTLPDTIIDVNNSSPELEAYLLELDKLEDMVTRRVDSLNFLKDNENLSPEKEGSILPKNPHPFHLTFNETIAESEDQMIPEVFNIQHPPIETTPGYMISDHFPELINLNEVKKVIGYPQHARDAGIDGTVLVRVIFDQRGIYKNHQIINSIHPILSHAVEQHIQKIRCEPYYIGEKAYPQTVNIPFIFHTIN